jgi:hypothetical protein
MAHKYGQSEQLRDWIAEFNDHALLIDHCDAAIIGVAVRCSQPTLVVYDYELLAEAMASNSEMDYDEAEEFVSFNYVGAWNGENTPLFLYRRPPEDTEGPGPSTTTEGARSEEDGR